MHTDIIVIGSGFAGSVAASRFAEAGLQVLVLERGPWRETPQVKAAGIKAEKLPAENRPGLVLRHIRPPVGPKQITFNKKGMLELHIGDGVKTVSSSNVGGGSHLWSALIGRPVAPDYWDNRAEGLSEGVMQPHYERVWSELKPIFPTNAEQLSNHTSYAWQEQGWFEGVQESEQYPIAINLPEPFAPEKAEDSLHVSSLKGEDGMFGCPSGAKANAEVTYLLPHLGSGINLLDMHEVQSVTKEHDLFTIKVRDHRNKQNLTFTADRVVLAAGTMNSVKLLCDASQNKTLPLMPALGKGFGTNGDCLATWTPKTDKESALGTPVHGQLKTKQQSSKVTVLSAGMETPPLPSWLPEGLRRKISSTSAKYQLVAMAADDANGEIFFSNGRLNLRYSIDQNPVFEEVFSALTSIANASSSAVKFDRKVALTAHPLGGARIANSSEEGVVDGSGQVYGIPGLFITDGSVFPAATGAPPTFSIAAWSSYVAEQIIEEIKPKLKKIMEKEMFTAIVTYKPTEEKTIADIKNAFEASIPFFSEVPGLIKKIYCFDEENFQGTSVYLWESREAAEGLYANPVFLERFKQSFGCEPTVTIIPVMQVVDNS